MSCARLSGQVRGGWLDRLVGSDPGCNRLRAALHTVAGIAVILAAEWLFVHFSHARAQAVWPY